MISSSAGAAMVKTSAETSGSSLGSTVIPAPVIFGCWVSGTLPASVVVVVEAAMLSCSDSVGVSDRASLAAVSVACSAAAEATSSSASAPVFSSTPPITSTGGSGSTGRSASGVSTGEIVRAYSPFDTDKSASLSASAAKSRTLSPFSTR